MKTSLNNYIIKGSFMPSTKDSKIDSIVTYLDKEIESLLCEYTGKEKEIKVAILSKMGMDLFTKCDEEFIVMFLKVLQQLVPKSNSMFTTILGSSVVLASARLQLSGRSILPNVFSEVLADVIDEIHKI